MSRFYAMSLLTISFFFSTGLGTESYAGWGRGACVPSPPHNCWCAPHGHYKWVTTYEYRKVPCVTYPYAHRCHWHRPVVGYKLVKVPVKRLVWCGPDGTPVDPLPIDPGPGNTAPVIPAPSTGPTVSGAVSNLGTASVINQNITGSNGTVLPQRAITRVASGTSGTPFQARGTNGSAPALGSSGTAPSFGSNAAPATGSNGTVNQFNIAPNQSRGGSSGNSQFRNNSFGGGFGRGFRGGGRSR